MEQDFRWGGINLRYLFQYLLKYLWIWLAIGTVLFLAGNFLAMRSASIKYSTQAIVYVIEGDTAPLPNNYTNRVVLAGSAKSVITSSAFLWDVKGLTGISDVDVYPEVIPNTNLISITCSSDNPKSCYDFLRGIIGNFRYITKYISGDISLKILKAPEIPTAEEINTGSSPPPILLGIGGFILPIFIVICLYLLRITYKGIGEISIQFGKDILLIIPYVKTWDKKYTGKAVSKKDINQQSIALNEIRKLSYIIKQETDKNDKKIFFFTSAGSFEGKHTICKYIVKELADLGLDVFYMDGTLMNVLSHETISDDMITHDLQLQCDTIKAESEAQTYSCESVSSLLSKIRSEKDAVIICGDSGKDMAMLSAWSKLSDGAYLIIRENTEDIRKIDSIYTQLKNISPSFDGCILNAFIIN